MAVLDPPGTLLRIAGLSLLSGAAGALVGAALILLASLYLPPRVQWGRIWADWRRRRVLWGVSLLLSAFGAVLAAESLARAVGLRDLYWLGRAGELLLISRLGALSGYLLALLVMVLAAWRTRARGGARS